MLMLIIPLIRLSKITTLQAPDIIIHGDSTTPVPTPIRVESPCGFRPLLISFPCFFEKVSVFINLRFKYSNHSIKKGGFNHYRSDPNGNHPSANVNILCVISTNKVETK